MNFFFSFLFGAGIVSVASMAVSSAESRIPEVPSAPALRPVSGSIKAGYSTNYEFRGLIPAGCNPTAPLRLDWRSDLNDRYSLILALKEEIFLGHPAVDIENETMVDLGLQRKFGKATYAALSFRANDGGLAGFASERLFGNGGTTYEAALIMRHDVGFLPGFYAQGAISSDCSIPISGLRFFPPIFRFVLAIPDHSRYNKLVTLSAGGNDCSGQENERK